MNRANKVLLITFFFLMCWNDFVYAESADTMNVGSRILTTEEVVKYFTTQKNITSADARGVIRIKSEDKELPESRAISLQIRFAFNSYSLTSDSIKQLKPVGVALASRELDSIKFNLEGHTDASGSESYNKALSGKRADVVKRFFMERFGIPSSRIATVARGESKLLNREEPYSGVNRRVKLVAIY